MRSRDDKPAFPDSALVEMANDHLRYEIEMMYAAALEYGRAADGSNLHNCAVESFATHSRIVKAIFFREGTGAGG